MKKRASLFNPYSLLILAVFVEYFPAFAGGNKPSVSLGMVNIFIDDIAFIFLCLYAFVIHLSGQKRSSVKRNNTGGGIQIMFALFFAYSCFKWLLQGSFDTASVRMALSYVVAYLFLFFFPLHISRKEDLRKLLYLLAIFLAYIFILHIYAFATEGYKTHILGGAFLSMLGILYFLAVRENDLLKLSPITSFFVRALVVVTYFMVGHRSGLIALLLGLVVYSFYYKKSAVKELFAIITIMLVGAGVALIASPKLLSSIEDRASTTFDSSQQTYVGRFDNIFSVYEVSKENPLIGKPLVTNESIQTKRIKITKGNITRSIDQELVTPHNLFLEWLFYYGWIGVMLGLSLTIASVLIFKRFLRDHRNNIGCRHLGIVMLCAMIHNLFFSLSNPSVSNLYSTFFLYFPLVILVTISRNKESYCK